MSRKTKETIIIIAALLIMGMAVVYAAVSRTLVIAGTSRAAGNVGVIITGISDTGNFTSGGQDTIASSFNETTATFDATLSEPGESVTYIVTVQNKGNVVATLTATNYKVGASSTSATPVDNISAVNSAEPSEIVFNVTGPTTDPLPVNATATYTVTATWNADATNLSPDSVKTMVMELVYEQST